MSRFKTNNTCTHCYQDQEIVFSRTCFELVTFAEQAIWEINLMMESSVPYDYQRYLRY